MQASRATPSSTTQTVLPPQSPSAKHTSATTQVATTRLHFNGEVKLADILTSLSLLVAAVTVIIGVVKDRKLRRREYADQVRSGASRAAVASARRREIALSFYDALQPAITKADMTIVKSKDVIDGRDQLWIASVAARFELRKRLLNEKIEEAYAALYGYDTRIRLHFERTISALSELDDEAYNAWLDESQSVLFAVEDSTDEYVSADFGNPLRDTCETLRLTFAMGTESIVEEFQSKMASIIQASDVDILKRHLPL